MTEFKTQEEFNYFYDKFLRYGQFEARLCNLPYEYAYMALWEVEDFLKPIIQRQDPIIRSQPTKINNLESYVYAIVRYNVRHASKKRETELIGWTTKGIKKQMLLVDDRVAPPDDQLQEQATNAKNSLTITIQYTKSESQTPQESLPWNFFTPKVKYFLKVNLHEIKSYSQWRIVAYHQIAGLKPIEIARRFKVSKQYVSKVLKQYLKPATRKKIFRPDGPIKTYKRTCWLTSEHILSGGHTIQKELGMRKYSVEIMPELAKKLENKALEQNIDVNWIVQQALEFIANLDPGVFQRMKAVSERTDVPLATIMQNILINESIRKSATKHKNTEVNLRSKQLSFI